MRVAAIYDIHGARVIKTRTTGGSRSVQRAAAQTLVTLKDDGYVPITLDRVSEDRAR